MTRDETAILDAARMLAHADRATDVAAAIAPEVAAVLAGRERSRAFTGVAFDLLARALLSSSGHGAIVRARIAALCDDSEARFGAEPWSELYRGCLAHLDGDAAAATISYHRAGRDLEVLWPNSIGCRSVVAPDERAAWLAADPPPLAPISIERHGQVGDTMLFVACDTRYLRGYARAYLRSVAAWAPTAGLHLHLLDPAPDDADWLEREAGALWPRITLSAERCRGPDRRAWYALARFARLDAILAQHDRRVLVTDIDAALTRPLAHPDTDIGLRIKARGFHAHPWQTVQAGALTIAPTIAGHAAARMIATLARHLFAARAGQGIWFADQNMLFAAWRALDDAGATRIADIAEDRLPGGLVFGRSL